MQVRSRGGDLLGESVWLSIPVGSDSKQPADAFGLS
jgi:hypothetical protein